MIDRPLDVSGGQDDEPRVVLQHPQPRRQTSGVVLPGLERQTKVGAQEGCTKFGDQFLPCIAFAAMTLATEVPFQATGIPGPIASFHGPGRCNAN